LKQAQRNYPSWGTLIEPVDMARLAPAMGCDGVMVDSAGALQDALSRRASDRPLVIGAVIDPAQYAAQF
jgi:acetolactate synthase-1/2/3 large subunit